MGKPRKIDELKQQGYASFVRSTRKAALKEVENYKKKGYDSHLIVTGKSPNQDFNVLYKRQLEEKPVEK